MTTQCLCCEQRDAGYRYACDHCVNDMRRWLRELEDYAAVIASTMAPVASPTVGSVGSAFGSRPPLSIAKVVFLDYRSGAGAAVHRLFDPRDMDEEPVRSLPGSVHGLAVWLREEAEVEEPARWTLVSELHYLLSRLDGCAYSQWVSELFGDIRELHVQARRLAKDSPPGPLGHCLIATCAGTVFPATIKDSGGHDGGRCDTCGDTYTGTRLLRLGAQEAG